MRLAGWSDRRGGRAPASFRSRTIARQRVLRRGELHRRIGGAQRVEMFSGLFAELFERRAFWQVTGGCERHDDSFRDSARVRSTG